jgi:hypothetical protein
MLGASNLRQQRRTAARARRHDKNQHEEREADREAAKRRAEEIMLTRTAGRMGGISASALCTAATVGAPMGEASAIRSSIPRHSFTARGGNG